MVQFKCGNCGSKTDTEDGMEKHQNLTDTAGCESADYVRIVDED